MKRWHYIVENILMILTAVVFLENRIYGYDLTGFFAWMALLGFFQLIHAVIILLGYFHNKKIRWWIALYWIFVIPYLLIIPPDDVPKTALPQEILFPILPLLFAVYLWYTSFRFRKRKIKDPGKNNRNAVLF
jgi:hypothetical protein